MPLSSRLALLWRKQDTFVAPWITFGLLTELCSVGIADAAKTKQSGDTSQDPRVRAVHQVEVPGC